MSYTVEYNPELRRSYPIKKQKMHSLPIKPVAITIGVFSAFYTAYRLGILRWIIPGDPAVTTGAFSTMIEDVRSGQGVSEAVFSFCKNVISGGVQ